MPDTTTTTPISLTRLAELRIRFLSACDDAAPDVNEREQGTLTVRKFRAIETAYEAMGKELDRVRRDA